MFETANAARLFPMSSNAADSESRVVLTERSPLSLIGAEELEPESESRRQYAQHRRMGVSSCLRTYGVLRSIMMCPPSLSGVS